MHLRITRASHSQQAPDYWAKFICRRYRWYKRYRFSCMQHWNVMKCASAPTSDEDEWNEWKLILNENCCWMCVFRAFRTSTVTISKFVSLKLDAWSCEQTEICPKMTKASTMKKVMRIWRKLNYFGDCLIIRAIMHSVTRRTNTWYTVVGFQCLMFE